MPDDSRKARLKQSDKDFILERLARNHRPQRIAQDLQLERGVITTRQNIQGHKTRNPEIIQTLREQFIKSLGSNSLTEKAERVTELQRLYDRFLDNCGDSFSKENIEVLQSLIAQIQKEVEPLKIQGEGFGNSSILIIRANGDNAKAEDKTKDVSRRLCV